MFGLFKRESSSPEPPAPDIRDTLFGDLPLAEWPRGGDGATEPWQTFVRARADIEKGDVAGATAAWHRVIAMPDLESRHYAQAWHFLRAHGVRPPPERAKQLLGVVLEVPMGNGLDLLAAYPERTARFYSHASGGVVWERPDSSLDAHIDGLLIAGRHVLDAIGPWEQPRPPAPPPGQVRLNFLSPAGLHFGQGPFQTLANDPMAKPVIDAGTALLQQLVERGLASK